MANIKLSAYGSPVVVLAGASEMNSLASGSVGAVSSTGTGVILDNTALNNIIFDFELFTSTLPGAPTLGSTVELHAYGSIDGGTTYATSLAAGASPMTWPQRARPRSTRQRHGAWGLLDRPRASTVATPARNWAHSVPALSPPARPGRLNSCSCTVRRKASWGRASSQTAPTTASPMKRPVPNSQ